MARPSRLILPQLPHHIIQRGNDRQLIFRDQEDYQRFLVWLQEAARFYRVAVHAYVLLPTHFQLLVTPEDSSGLGAMMQKLGRYYVPWYNNKYQRAGGLFEGRFRTAVVAPDQHFLMCSRYIELASLREGSVIEPASYPWSSYAHHAGLGADPVITDHALFWELGNTPFQREAAHRAWLAEGIAGAELALIAQAVQTGQPLAARAFTEALERTIQRRILPAQRGRPRKSPCAAAD